MKISKSWITGAVTVDYACPGCRHPLFSKVDDIGRQDKCANCGRAFIVPGKKLYAEYMASEEEKRGLQAAAKQKKEEEAAAVAKAIEAEREQRAREADLAAEVVFEGSEEFDANLVENFPTPTTTSLPKPHDYPAIRLISVVYTICAWIAATVGALAALGGFIGTAKLSSTNEHRLAWMAMVGAILSALFGLLAWATLKMIPELLTAFLRIERNTQIAAAMLTKDHDTK